jgi:hypothetical protein
MALKREFVRSAINALDLDQTIALMILVFLPDPASFLINHNRSFQIGHRINAPRQTPAFQTAEFGFSPFAVTPFCAAFFKDCLAVLADLFG